MSLLACEIIDPLSPFMVDDVVKYCLMPLLSLDDQLKFYFMSRRWHRELPLFISELPADLSQEFIDSEFLKKCTNLKTLKMHDGSERIYPDGIINSFPNLINLEIESYRFFSDFSGSDLYKLHTLRISGAFDINIEELDHLTSLKSLEIINTWTYYSPISKLVSLKSLKIKQDEDNDIYEMILQTSHLEGLTDLETLVLGGIDSKMKLPYFPKLRNLELTSKLKTVDDAYLMTHNNLTRLSIYYCPKITLHGLLSITTLRMLSISLGPQVGFESFMNLPDLVSLKLPSLRSIIHQYHMEIELSSSVEENIRRRVNECQKIRRLISSQWIFILHILILTISSLSLSLSLHSIYLSITVCHIMLRSDVFSPFEVHNIHKIIYQIPSQNHHSYHCPFHCTSLPEWHTGCSHLPCNGYS